jgi:transcriptional regulator with XRE-family HTH domain
MRTDTNVDADTVATRIKAARVALGLSQRKFAKGLYVSQSYFGDIETGNRRISERIIHLISLNYNISKEWLKTGQGEMLASPAVQAKLQKLSGVFAELDELLQDYLIKQANELLEIQKKIRC